MNLIETSIKVSRVIHSAQTYQQKKSAERYAKLFRELVKREVDKLHPIRDVVVAALVTLFAFIGVVTVLSLVAHGIID